MDARCQQCSTPVEPGALFCSKCGMDVSAVHPAADETLAMTAVGGTAQPVPPVRSTMRQSLRDATLGEYEILNELGRGGMATVFLAHDISLDRKVAIKVMAPHLLEGEGMAERFKLEARTAAQLSHPHIIPIYAVKETAETLYFVMKFIEGRGLDEIIKKTGQLPIPMVKDILVKVGGSLGYAHRRGVVHRDIKPANIMIDDEGTPIVTDYGIAKVAEASGLTMTGTTIGTPSYMSPEQCEAKEVAGAADQYALGVVAFQMLTGRLPFEGDSAMTIMYKHCHEELPPLGDFRPDCPPEMVETVTRMLAKDPADRWPSLEAAVQKMGTQTVSTLDPVREQLMALAQDSGAHELIAQLSNPSLAAAGGATTGGALIGGTSVSGVTTGTATTGTGAGIATPGGGRSRAIAAAVATVAVLGGGTLAVLRPWVADTPPAALVDNSAAAANGGEQAASEGGETGLDDGGAASGSPASGEQGAGDAPGGGPETTAGSDDAADEDVVAGSPQSGTNEPVRVQIAVQTVLVDGVPSSLEAGEGATLSARAMDGSGIVIPESVVEDCGDHGWSRCGYQWSSSAPSVVSIGPDGTLTAHEPGQATVRVSVGGTTGEVDVTVAEAAVADLSVSPASLSMSVGDRERLTAQGRSGGGAEIRGRPVRWESADESVASVDSRSGEVVARGAGGTTLTASMGNRTTTIPVEVVLDDSSAIEELIAEYVEALASLDLGAVQRLYPNMPQDTRDGLDGIFRNARSFTPDLTVQSIDVRGDAATALIAGNYNVDDRSAGQMAIPVNVTANFERTADGWRIAGMTDN